MAERAVMETEERGCAILLNVHALSTALRAGLVSNTDSFNCWLGAHRLTLSFLWESSSSTVKRRHE